MTAVLLTKTSGTNGSRNRRNASVPSRTIEQPVMKCGRCTVSDLAAPMSSAKAEPSSDRQEKTVRKPKPRSAIHHSPLWLTLLPFLITAGTFVLSFAQQYRQHKDDTQATQDSEWRKALEQVSSKESDVAIQGAYEMESFLSDQQHGPQALSITSALLPNVNDQRFFDIILSGLFPKADQTNQSQFIAVNVALAGQLNDEYYSVLKTLTNAKSSPADQSFADFLMHPDQFYREDSESDKLAYVLTKTWELDSVSHSLSKLWNHGPGVPGATPNDQWLSGVVLFNNDYSKADFRNARGMDEVLFVGNCKVNKTALPSGVDVKCAAPNPAS